MEAVVTAGAIRRAKLQSNRHHQQTNTVFTDRMPFLSPNQQCQSTDQTENIGKFPAGKTLCFTVRHQWRPHINSVVYLLGFDLWL